MGQVVAVHNAVGAVVVDAVAVRDMAVVDGVVVHDMAAGDDGEDGVEDGVEDDVDDDVEDDVDDQTAVVAFYITFLLKEY